jgi:DNA (cytosine-5)-methyltransferase 1
MGNADPRHLFPTWRRLIARCGPPRVAGEQVASKLGREWLARVRLEMATLGYATRGTDLCSAGVFAPNRRQRLYWLADTACERPSRRNGGENRRSETESQRLCEAGPVAHTNGQRLEERKEPDGEPQRPGEQAPRRLDIVRCGEAGAMGDADGEGREGRRLRSEQDTGQRAPWSAGVVGVQCTDGGTRRIKPGIFPLAPRLPGDVALIRGAGNAINPWVAAEFLRDVI